MTIKEQLQTSPYWNNPELFLNVGDRVVAIIRVYDLPGNEDQGPIHAEEGESGTVIHTEKGYWPTVRFDRTGSASCVTHLEVKRVD